MTYSELDGDGEEVDSDLLSNLLTTWNTREVDIARLDETLLALDSLEQLLGKSGNDQVRHISWSSISRWAYRKPAYAIERVAEPRPSLALTTSSPPNCTRFTRSAILSSGISTEGFAWLNRGTIVSPE